MKVIEKAPKLKADVAKFDERIVRKRAELEKAEKRKLNLYEDLKDGIISKKEYLQLKEAMYMGIRKHKPQKSGRIYVEGTHEPIIRDEKYTGTMVQLKTKLDSVGGKQVSRGRTVRRTPMSRGKIIFSNTFFSAVTVGDG